jgi:integrating conjugative element protein (TIGR03758 family)
MAMSPAQNAAFSAAAGGHSPADVSTLFASIVLVLLFIWAAWLITRALSALYRRNAKDMDLVWIGLRASALIAIAIWLVN